jgi:hypothetical protein
MSGATASTMSSKQAAPVRVGNINVIPEYGSQNGTHLTPSDPPNTLIYRVAKGDGSPLVPARPILAPDGHQVTLGEYVHVSGSAAVKCINEGTHSVVHVSGLIPNGVYTIWYVVPNQPGFPMHIPFLRVGPAGTDDGTQNRFDASASGEGELSAITPAGNFVFAGGPGPFPSCAFTYTEFSLVGAYHIDQRTWGPVPGNPADPGSVIDEFEFAFHN